MYNIEKIKTEYDYYKLLLEKKDILTKQIEEFEKNEANKGIIELYNLLKKDSREKKINFDENPLVEDLFSKHDKVFDYYELKDNLKICENNIRDLIEECVFEIGIPLNNQIIILNNKDEIVGYVPEGDSIIFARLMNAGKMLFSIVKSISHTNSVPLIEIDIYLKDF